MRTTLIIIAAVAASLFIALFIWRDGRFLAKASADFRLDSATTTKTTPAEYLQLFKKSNKLVPDGSDLCKRRNAVSKFYYDKKYFLEVYKIDAAGNLPVCEMIREQFVDMRMSPGVDYLEYAGDADFAVEYLSRPPEKVSNVFLTLYGDSTRTIAKNDTMACYYSRFKSFSLRNAPNKPEDIYGHLADGHIDQKTPLELMFLRRHKNLYFILMGSQNSSIPLGCHLLCNLVAVR